MMMQDDLINDCFALPQGIFWTPVDEALRTLRNGLSCLAKSESVLVSDCDGRILSEAVYAKNSNPPNSNAAVDGYGFCGGILSENKKFKIFDGRVAAGDDFRKVVPDGFAIRILTGAVLPSGVDTIVLDEECTVERDYLLARGPLKKGSNTRYKGEDIGKGDLILQPGHVLKPQDLALLSAVGVMKVKVFIPLKVAVISTGNEVYDGEEWIGQKIKKGKIFDSNRPMLLALLRKWNLEIIDLGIVADNIKKLRTSLDKASKNADVILSSGGVSGGDEDYVSHLLKSEGILNSWRIAVKPGRPLALGRWNGKPFFGLPGNPVASYVCSLIFLRPALGVLSGSGWKNPIGFSTTAAFEKNKKKGRREFLRARIRDDGHVEVFPSEGSGRISSLSWSNGLVELDDMSQTIVYGDKVRFLPYSSFDF